MKRILLIIAVAFGLLWGSTACTTQDTARAAIKAYFPDQYTKAVAVATCESGLNPAAVSPGGQNWGLFQINKVHVSLVNSMGYSWSQILDPFVNSRVARRIYDDAGGWGPWACG